MSHRLKTRLLVLALSPFILSACGGGGSSGTTEPFAGDTIPPVLNFEPATLQVASGGTADSSSLRPIILAYAQALTLPVPKAAVSPAAALVTK